MVLVIGSQGNMGKRYCAILKALEVEHVGLDIRQANYSELIEEAIFRCDKIIITTPTQKHLETIQLISSVRRQRPTRIAHVLCEKPLVTKADSLRWLRKEQDSGLVRIFCVNQYSYLPEHPIFARTNGRTYYNYFKHGGDGLEWDCFQLFGLARGTVVLNESAPIWNCKINGTKVSISGMDHAYVSMISDFLGQMRRLWDLDKAEEVTRKVLRWIEQDKEESL